MKRISFFLVALGLSLPIFAYAQTTTLTDAQRVALQQELAQVEAEQKQAAADLATAQNKSSSLARDIAVLDAKIKAAQLDIKAKNILIQSLADNIIVKQARIGNLEDRISQGKETLAQILRKTNEMGDYSLPEMILSETSLSGFFQDFDQFQSVQNSMKTTFEQIRADKASTTAEKDALDVRKNAASDARYAIQQQQKNIQSNQAQEKQLLAISKGSEKTYTSLVAQKQVQASKIRAALFQLAGSTAIPFGDALKYAQEAQKLTSIRPAFLLAVITQESNLGSNVGSCLVTDLNTGNGVGKNTGSAFEQVMKAPRDTVKFVDITKSLGMEWSTTPVSCPIGDKAHNYDATKYYVGRGFGGAMGPAQFIPSTWDNGTDSSFKNRIAKALGISIPNPWNPEHAFMAAALYLTDLGAVNGSYTGEVKAACKYFGTGGSSCTYGRQVADKADTIQRTMIDQLQ